MIGWGFCAIHNNQSRGRGFQLKLKAETDNPYWDYSGYHEKLILIIVFVIHWMKKKWSQQLCFCFFTESTVLKTVDQKQQWSKL